jgi:hypothetical protein
VSANIVAAEPNQCTWRASAAATAVIALLFWLTMQVLLDPLLTPCTAAVAVLTAGLLVELPAALGRKAPMSAVPGAMLRVAALALALAWLDGAGFQAGASAVLAVGTLFLTVGAICLLAPPRAIAAVHALSLSALVALTLTPVWLAEGLASMRRTDGFIDGLVAMNPLTLLAAGTGVDYLRSEWFYRYSPIGSLRYDYPEALMLLSVWMAGVALLWVGVALRRAATRRHPKGRAFHIPQSNEAEIAP